jgi:hypothetical protein
MRKGYIFITSTGYDPEKGKAINDPYLGDVPTLGACMPKVRRAVVPGDQIFVVTGSVPGIPQYVISGFEVAEKIHASEAFARFPQLRLHIDRSGNPRGNIIIDEFGNQSELDNHDGFERRVENYVVGANPLIISESSEIERARAETMSVLRSITGKEGLKPIEVIGRCSRLDESQIGELLKWLMAVKQSS